MNSFPAYSHAPDPRLLQAILEEEDSGRGSPPPPAAASVEGLDKEEEDFLREGVFWPSPKRRWSSDDTAHRKATTRDGDGMGEDNHEEEDSASQDTSNHSFSSGPGLGTEDYYGDGNANFNENDNDGEGFVRAGFNEDGCDRNGSRRKYGQDYGSSGGRAYLISGNRSDEDEVGSVGVATVLTLPAAKRAKFPEADLFPSRLTLRRKEPSPKLDSQKSNYSHVVEICTGREAHVALSSVPPHDLDQWVMHGRRKVLLSALYSKFVEPNLPWVLLGVIGTRGSAKTNEKNQKFLVWTLSDLHGSTVSVFVHSHAFKAHGLLPEGTVVALLSPLVQRSLDNYQSLSLVAKEANHVCVLGKAADFAHCRASMCSQAIDKRFASLCSAHNKLHLDSISSNRMDLLSTGSSSLVSLAKTFKAPEHVSKGRFQAPWDVKAGNKACKGRFPSNPPPASLKSSSAAPIAQLSVDGKGAAQLSSKPPGRSDGVRDISAILAKKSSHVSLTLGERLVAKSLLKEKAPASVISPTPPSGPKCGPSPAVTAAAAAAAKKIVKPKPRLFEDTGIKCNVGGHLCTVCKSTTTEVPLACVEAKHKLVKILLPGSAFRCSACGILVDAVAPGPHRCPTCKRSEPNSEQKSEPKAKD